MDMLTFIGLPWMKDGKLYNVAAAIKDGELFRPCSEETSSELF